MTPFEKFLHDVHEIHSSGAAVDETAYYGPLETLLNEIGKAVKPRVRCIIHIKNRGAGLPDGGLFTQDQFGGKSPEPKQGQLPSRGAIEVKPPKESASAIGLSDQVARYLSRYRQVLVTNLREFALVAHDLDGNPTILETYQIADSAQSFWKAAAHPRKTDEAHGSRLAEYLKRVMLHAAPLAAPEDVAFFLASYAREALARIEAADLDAMAAVRGALEEALGLKFEGKKGEHFFHSSLIQTLFYGVFSAWVLWARKRPGFAKDRFHWNDTARLLRVPIIRKLFHEVADPGQLDELNLTEVLDWTATVLNRVDHAQFFAKFQESQAVQYFYEPFLEAFDPELRKQLGVWYTPHEVVQYMVARVDTVLREELDLPDGLADKNVYVLDPCCGTGSFLVEVLQRIHETLKRKGDDALLASDLKEAAQTRIFGFEILPAPFVVSHLQLGLLLQNLGAPLSDKKSERVGVFLTNALTGWEPPKEPKKRLLFPELEEERDAAEHVKRDTPILVILGNPPYNGFAGVSPAEEQGLVEPYKEGLVREWKIKKFNLDDLYVRFFRLAERRITEKTQPGQGVLCFISNFSYLSDPSFVVMRKRLLKEFQSIWIDCLNGDSRETGKITPDGKPNPSIFSTARNREGIRVGTAVGLMVRTGPTGLGQAKVLFRHFWGAKKKPDLLASLSDNGLTHAYQISTPSMDNRLSLRPSNVRDVYHTWPKLTEISETAPMNGLMEKRAGALMDSSRTRLQERMRKYYDADTNWDEFSEISPALTRNAARFNARKARMKIQAAEAFSEERLLRYALRPFDIRWAYYSSIRPLWNEPRPQLWCQYSGGNEFLMTRPAAVADPEGAPVFWTKHLGDNDFLRGHAYYFPHEVKAQSQLGRRTRPNQGSLISVDHSAKPNLSECVKLYLERLNADQRNPTVWLHVLAVGYSPAYLCDNADAIRQDWPRIPLPNTSQALLASAALGRQVADLLDTESPVDRVTTGEIPELRPIGTVTRIGGGHLNDTDLAVKAGWGHAGQGGVTMPGRGKTVERDYSPAERTAICSGARALGLSPEQILSLLGCKTLDVYVNDVAYWANVPANVWDYTIGGYQVIKKWLSYREEKLLGRPLTKDEVRYVQEMVRRIAAILLLGPALDANYAAIKADAFPWHELSTTAANS